MENVVSLKAISTKQDRDEKRIADQLEIINGLIEFVKRGEVTSFASVFICEDRTARINYYCHPSEGFALTGGVARLLYRMHADGGDISDEDTH